MAISKNDMFSAGGIDVSVIGVASIPIGRPSLWAVTFVASRPSSVSSTAMSEARGSDIHGGARALKRVSRICSGRLLLAIWVAASFVLSPSASTFVARAAWWPVHCTKLSGCPPLLGLCLGSELTRSPHSCSHQRKKTLHVRRCHQLGGCGRFGSQLCSWVSVVGMGIRYWGDLGSIVERCCVHAPTDKCNSVSWLSLSQRECVGASVTSAEVKSTLFLR